MRVDGHERDALVALTVLVAGLGEVIEDGLLEVWRGSICSASGFADRLAAGLIDGRSERDGAVRGKALDGERPAYPDLLPILVRAVVELLEVGVPFDGPSISLRLIPSLISGLFAMDLSVMCWTRS